MEAKRAMNMRSIGVLAALCLAIVAMLGFAKPAQAASLNANNLLQGEYSADASMVNTATKQPSSADGALVRPIKITVNAKHEYMATLSMKTIAAGPLTGYADALFYFDGKDYKRASQAKITDAGDGNNYPGEFSFPLLNKAAGDEEGYVALKVNVPIIAAVSHGAASSLQNVYLDINWKSLKQTKELEKVSGGVTYAISGKNATVTSISKNAKSATVKPTVKIGGKTYKVTSVSKNAAAKSKKLTKVTLGKNLSSIGSKAFYNSKKLKTITFQGKSVKKIGSKAFKGVYKKATFKAPKSKVKAYKKLVKKAGAPKTAKYKAA